MGRAEGPYACTIPFGGERSEGVVWPSLIEMASSSLEDKLLGTTIDYV